MNFGNGFVIIVTCLGDDLNAKSAKVLLIIENIFKVHKCVELIKDKI